MPNHKKVYWYCGAKHMLPVKTWFVCTDCGAMHVPQTKGSFAPVTEVDAATGGAPRVGKATEFRPSGRAVRAAEKAREKASRS